MNSYKIRILSSNEEHVVYKFALTTTEACKQALLSTLGLNASDCPDMWHIDQFVLDRGSKLEIIEVTFGV